MTGDIATMGALIGAGLATFGMGGAAIGVAMVVGSVFKYMPKKADNSTMFVGVELSVKVKSKKLTTSVHSQEVFICSCCKLKMVRNT